MKYRVAKTQRAIIKQYNTIGSSPQQHLLRGVVRWSSLSVSVKRKIKLFVLLLCIIVIRSISSFFFSRHLNKPQLRQLDVQESLGQSNLISISQRGQSVPKPPCSNTPTHNPLTQTLYSFPLFQSHNDPVPHCMP